MQKFFDLRREHLVIPSEQEVEAEDDETRFQNGREAMVLSSRRATPAFRTIRAFDWDIAPLPKHDEQAGILHSDAYCMTKASGNKEAAWAFMEFALGPEGQRITARSGRTVPSLKAVASRTPSSTRRSSPPTPRSSSTRSPSSSACRRSRPGPRSRTCPERSSSRASTEACRPSGSAEQLVERTAPIFERAER